MDGEEIPLLNEPNVMLLLLKAASREPASVADGAQELRRLLQRVGEPARLDQHALAMLARSAEHLRMAGLLQPVEHERYRITDRGRQALAQHPEGIDDSVLAQFQEFRDQLRELVPHEAPGDVPDDPHAHEYDQGVVAYRAGLAHTDNPYQPDTVRHLAWENGWFGARDAPRERSPSIS